MLKKVFKSSKHHYRIKVLEDTLKIFENECYKFEDDIITIEKNDFIEGIKNSKKYTRNEIIKRYEEVSQKNDFCQIFLIDNDCLDIGVLFKERGYNPVVLNMASATHPGGGYKMGAGTQEESLFRRTNLAYCLDKQKDLLYPIPETGLLYTKNALVIKKSEQNNYAIMKNYQKVSFISSAAHRCNYSDVSRDKKLKNGIYHVTDAKIDSIFKTAIIENHDCLILSAYGCGAYKNPPEEIANLFKKHLNIYKNNFRFIVFAILDDHNSFRNSKKGNLQTFSEILNIPIKKYDDLFYHVKHK